jgi:ketosteroid isomerase-like protein
MKKIAVLFCTYIILIGCTSTPKVDTIAEAKAIRNLENQWTVALQTKDIDKCMTFYSPEGVQMMPNNAIFVGLQGVRKQFELVFADTAMLWNTFSGSIDIIEVSASGDLAYVRGNNRFSIKTPTGLVENTEKWIDIWKKIDGQWKCIVGIYNSNMPLAGK